MSDIIVQSIIEFHTKADGYQYSAEEYNFGVFSLEIANTPMTTDSQFVHSGNDMSGSMSDRCSDTRSKMQHLHLTLENIINLFSKNADFAKITLEITGFDDKIENVLSPTKIINDYKQIEEITAKIKQILMPRGSTNIQIALKDAKEKIALQTDQTKNFLFMTDGNITTGSSDIQLLKASVPTDSRNYFIGFGVDHDFQLLQNLAFTTNSGSYYYVDKIENAGLVFGEIIHSILYTALKSVVITTTNGEIYDFIKNEWTTRITVPYLCGEAKKKYHVRSATPHTFEINYSAEEVLTGNIGMWSETILPGLISDDNIVQTVDLRKNIYRQRTLELLAKASSICQNGGTTIDKKNMQTLMKNFRIDLEQYAKEYTDQSDIDYMKQLCDDLYISETTLLTDRALLYTVTRQMAQGSEGSYNITQVEYYHDEEDNEDNEYIISPIALNRACTSNVQENIMRECSQNVY
jgi:hypothetical protein